MDLVLTGLNLVTYLVYLDDVIVFSKDVEHHLQHLKEVFEKLRKVNLKLRADKCRLTRREVAFLGHLVSNVGVGADQNKI